MLNTIIKYAEMGEVFAAISLLEKQKQNLDPVVVQKAKVAIETQEMPWLKNILAAQKTAM